MSQLSVGVAVALALFGCASGESASSGGAGAGAAGIGGAGSVVAGGGSAETGAVSTVGGAGSGAVAGGSAIAQGGGGARNTGVAGSSAAGAPTGGSGPLGGAGGAEAEELWAPLEPGPPSTATVVDEQRSLPGHTDRLWELTVESEALGRSTQVRLLVPAGYDPSSTSTWPVLLLLHGGTDNYKSWSDKTNIEALTADLDLIVAMPDAGFAATYSNWYNDGNFGAPEWERFHVEELLRLLQDEYAANGRYVTAGLSSGGYGAMGYAARHPDLFAGAASFSGNLDRTSGDDLTSMQGDGILTSLLEQSAQYAQWGDPAQEEVRWRTHNPVDLAPNLRGLPLYVATGDGNRGDCDSGLGTDPVEEGVLVKNWAFVDRLDELGIAHAKNFYTPGTHTWCFWERELAASLPMLMDAVGEPRSVPSAFTYRSALDRFSVWGWQFEVTDRAELAFTDITIDGASVSATGNGTLEVITPALYEPGRAYLVGAASVQADARGALAFSLALGETAEQYTSGPDLPGPRPVGSPTAVSIVPE